MNEINTKIPSSTLAELRGVLVRALSRENLSNSDKIAIRKSRSSSSLKINCTWSSNASYGGKKMIYFTHVLGILLWVSSKMLLDCCYFRVIIFNQINLKKKQLNSFCAVGRCVRS